MTDVYAIIDALREHKYLSVRKLAELAGINPSTLATIMARKPKSISRKHLEALGGVLGAMWFDLVNVPEYAYSDDAKIPAALSDEDAEMIFRKLIGNEEKVCSSKCLPAKNPMTHLFEKQMDEERNGMLSELRRGQGNEDLPDHDAHYRQSIIYMLERLNTEGLFETMHHVLVLTRTPKYCRRTSNFETKGDTEWQEKRE